MSFFLLTGAQYRLLLPQQIDNIKKQINRLYADLVDIDRSVLLGVVENSNLTQLQTDLAKVLMNIKQGFIDIIVYDLHKVKKPVADALKRKENPRVYYPSEDGVNKDAFVDQFTNQLLFREGSWRPRGNPCARFELHQALSIMLKNKTVMKKMKTYRIKVS